jgi:predicted amidophosphoribosyltransferase
VASINRQKIYGNWVSGVALDVHTVSSVHLGINEYGHDVFDTTRSELGELLYRLKYQGDKSAAQVIIDTTAAYLKPYRSKFDILIPVPPSGARAVQPVIILAQGIGAAIGLPVVDCVSLTRSATPLKGVMERERRVELLDGLHQVDASQTEGKNVLLFDDLFRSGATMNAITDLLMQEGKAASVRVLAITRTRSSR